MPRPSARSAAAKRSRAATVAKVMVSQSPDGTSAVTEVAANTEEIICPVVEPPAKKRCHHKLDGQGSGVEGMHLVNSDPVELVSPTPTVISVQASKSQAHRSYPKMSKNKQCTCMALTFLAHQYEGLDLKRDDLNKILDMGDSLYRRTISRLKKRKQFVSHLLTMEETPTTVETEHNQYSVIKSNVEMGYMKDAGELHRQHWYVNLHARLQCLSASVTHALLTISPYTIAIFRDSLGRYGMFDSHSRNADGLPLPPWKGGTAVMMTFTHLNDLIAKIYNLNASVHSIPIDRMEFEFMPVTFVNTNAQSVHVHTDTSLPSTSRHQTTTMPSTKLSVPSTISSSTHLKKRPKSNRRKYLRRKVESQKPTTQKQSGTIEDIRAKKKKYLKLYKAKRFATDAVFKAKQKGYNTAYFSRKYNEDQDFKWQELQKQKYFKNKKYIEDDEFRQKRKAYLTHRYNTNKEFQAKQKADATTKYATDQVFKAKRKNYLKSRYHINEVFKAKRKNYDNSRYHKDEVFKAKRKNYDNSRYHTDHAFQAKRRAYSHTRFHRDEKLKEKMRKHMKHYMAIKCKTDVFFKMRRSIRQALKLKKRYMDLCRVQIRLRLEEKGIDNEKKARAAVITKQLQDSCIASFHKDIEDGPTFVCTTCHRALFSTQVQSCHREKYTKNLDIVAACLTGKYVHVCDNECGGPEECIVPKERHREWICKTCHRILQAGKMPDIAVANNLELAEIPSELGQLNVLERQMIALDIPFAKILTLPKGRQRAVHGAVVCVPSNVESTINTLPRRLDSSGLYRVKLKRRMRYKGYHLFHTVNVPKVVLALNKLIETHPDYQNISVRDDDDIRNDAVIDQLEELASGDVMDSCDDAEMMEVADYADAAASSQTSGDVMDSCDDAEMMEVADFAEAAASSQTLDQVPPTAEAEQDVLRPGYGIDSCLQPDDIGQDMMTYGDGIFTIAPAEGNKPVSYSTVPNLEANAFPTLFPTAQNTFDRKRPVKLSPSRYFNARLFGADPRFARDQTYLFFAQFVSETHMAKNTISIQLRKGKPKTKDGRRINNKILQDKAEVERLVKNRDATRFMSPMRGTPAYWQKTMLDLFAMIRQLGPPTFFVTISAAEFRWPEVIKAIKAQQGQIVDFDKLDWNEKCDILRSNAVTTMRMFDKRVSSFYGKVLFSDAHPLGRVIDWFHRVEYQARGSPHLHALLWIAGAPVYGVDSDDKICEFADRYISCQLPDPNEDPLLFKLVTELQMHSRNHTKSCRKGHKICRFGFPKPPVYRTFITNPKPLDPIQEEEEPEEGNVTDGATAGHHAASNSPRNEANGISKGISKRRAARAQGAMAKLKPLYDMLMDSASEVSDLSELLAKCNLTREEYESCLEEMRNTNTLLMKRGVKDGFVNNYNPVLLKAWGANSDIQFILNHYVCISYMLSYISKAESEMGELLKQVVVGIDPTKVSERDAMNQLVHSYVKNRQVSAQEAVARTCSLPLKKCSRQVIFLATDDNAMKMSLPLSTLQQRPDESEKVWMTGYLDRYNARPKTPQFDNMCLAEFVSEYRVVYGDEAKKPDCVKLSDDMGTMRKRQNDRPAVIRYAKFSQQKEPEKYYGNLLKVYLPHRYQSTLQTQTFPTYTEFYHNASVRLLGTNEIWPAHVIVARNREKYEKHSDSIDKAMEEFLENGPAEDAWANIAPENEQERLECLAQQNEVPLHNDEQDDVPEFCQVPDIAHVGVLVPQLSQDYLRRMYQNLNQKQASVFYSVRDWCLNTVNEQNPKPFFYFVTGGAGTGKSQLIKCIYGEATRILRRLPRLFEETDPNTPTVLLSAFTGTAAYNISGNTLHSLLKLPRSFKPPYTGLGNRLDDVRGKLGNAQILIIDEVSLISKDLFAFVYWRLQEIKGSRAPFGGMSVLVVGDFAQLPPTSQGKPLCVLEECKPDLFHEHFQKITLTEIMRQKDDVPYAELLNRLRVKGKNDPLSVADRALLAQRVTDREHCPKDVLHIFPTNKEVAAHNNKSLSELHTHIIDIPAEDYRRDERTHQMTRVNRACSGTQKDLLDNLQIAEGAPVVIIRNIDVEDGLVNGTFGKIDTVEYQVNQNGTTVVKLWLLLDKSEAGLKYRRPGTAQVYVERMEEYLSDEKVIRRQFPIKLAYACTAHKVQGMTTQAAVVSLKRIFQPGMAYVGLSRATTLQGLHILDFDEKKIYSDPEVIASLASMNTASLDSVMPLWHFRQTTNQAETLTIVHHNTQSLQAHIDDIRQHHELQLADVLCLTETHLTGSSVADGLQLDGYTMFSRNKHMSYASLPERAQQNGGGVAVYVKDHFQSSERRFIHNVTNLEFVVVKIESPVKLVIAAVYRPPGYGHPFLDNLTALLDALEIMDHHPIVLCGDFNEDLLSGFGGPISSLLQARGYTQLINEATTDKNTLLDHMYISRPHQCLQSGVLRTYYSYHNPVYCVLSSKHD